MAVRIGELLLKEKLITPEQLQQALTQQKSNGGKLGYNLVKMGFVKDEQITALLSKQYGVPAINLAQFKIDLTIVKLVPTETARKYQIIPLSRSGSTLTIAMTDPTNVFAMDDIKFMTGYTVEPVVASEVAITDAIEKYYPSGKAGAGGAGAGAPGAKGGKPGAGGAVTGSTLEMASRGLEELQNSLGGGADDVEVLEELDLWGIPVAGLAKEHEWLYVPGQSEPIILPPNSSALHLGMRMRDEAHRFAVTYHRQRRDKAMSQSALDALAGVGPVRKKRLMAAFGSVRSFKRASVDEIAAVKGMTPALASHIKSALGE